MWPNSFPQIWDINDAKTMVKTKMPLVLRATPNHHKQPVWSKLTMDSLAKKLGSKNNGNC